MAHTDGKVRALRKAGGVLRFPAYDVADLKEVSPFKEPHPAEAFVVLWQAIVRTDEKATESRDLDLWIAVRRKLRKLEHTVRETVPDGLGGFRDAETVVCAPEGGALSFTGAELALVTKLWEEFRKKMSLAQAERRALVDDIIYNPEAPGDEPGDSEEG